MKRPALAAIRFYQQRISPGMAPACRFQPTCSEYAYDAISAHGALRGIAMAAWRILRCNPLNDGGFEPVPETTQNRASQPPTSSLTGEGSGVRPRPRA